MTKPDNKNAHRRLLTCVATVLLLAHTLSAWSASTDKDRAPGDVRSHHLREAEKYRLEFDNDAFVGSDNQFSSGWSLQYHSAIAADWRSLDTPADWLVRFGEHLPGLQGARLVKRFNMSVGQIIQTPANLSKRELIANDVPYAAVIATQATWLAYSDEEFRGFEISLGIVGPAALGEPSQNLVHRLIGINEARGWDNQLNSEPVFNVNYMRKKKFYRYRGASGFSADAALNGHVALGTLFTLAALRIETRFGRNIPGGFVYSPDPIGHSMIYDAGLAPASPSRPSLYGSVSASAIAVAHDLLLDGNVFQRSHSIEKEPFIAMLTLGIHYEKPDWGAHMEWTFTTDTVETASLNAAEDADNTFGTLMFEWKL